MNDSGVRAARGRPAGRRPSARSYAQSFTSIFGEQVPPPYIDLGHFVELLETTARTPERAAGRRARAGDAESGGHRREARAGKPGATGVAIYFPNSQLYARQSRAPQSYSRRRRFADDSLWDDFLAIRTLPAKSLHRTAGASRDRGRADHRTRWPAGRRRDYRIPHHGLRRYGRAGQAGDVAPADISGENVGYVKLFAGFLDEAANSINITDMDYLESPDTRVINDVYYPAWPAQEFTMEFDREPIVFAVDDGAPRR